jgi:hypothetical protein
MNPQKFVQLFKHNYILLTRNFPNSDISVISTPFLFTNSKYYRVCLLKFKSLTGPCTNQYIHIQLFLDYLISFPILMIVE